MTADSFNRIAVLVAEMAISGRSPQVSAWYFNLAVELGIVFG